MLHGRRRIGASIHGQVISFTTRNNKLMTDISGAKEVEFSYERGRRVRARHNERKCAQSTKGGLKRDANQSAAPSTNYPREPSAPTAP